MSTSRLALPVLAVAAGLALAACGGPPGRQVQANVQTMRREQSPDKLVERGKAFASVGDLVRAEQYLAAAIEAGADEGAVLPILLKVCIDGKRYRVAIDYGEAHLKKHPLDHRLRFLVATLHAAVGDPAPARAHLEEVLRAVPADAEAHWALGVVVRDADRLEADRHFREYLRLSPGGPHAEEARSSLLQTVP